MGFVDDPWICLPLTLGVIAGSIGFPVLFELARECAHARTAGPRTPG